MTFTQLGFYMSVALDNIEQKTDRRRNPDGNQNYDIVKLWDRHNEIIRLSVAGVKSNIKIAELLGITPQTVSNVLNSPLAQARIQELSRERDEAAVSIDERIKELAPLATDVIRKTLLKALEDDGDRTDSGVTMRMGATTALGLLDHAVPKRTQGTMLHGHMTLSRIEEIKQGKFRAVEVDSVEQTGKEEEGAAI